MACCRPASKYEPNEHPSRDPANALELGPFVQGRTPWRLDSSAGLPLGIRALQELTSLCKCQLAHFHLFALSYFSCARRDYKKCFFCDPTMTVIAARFYWFLRQRNIDSDPHQMTRDSISELRFEQLVKLVLQAHRLVFSCHHGLPLSLVVQYLWSHWKVVRLVDPY